MRVGVSLLLGFCGWLGAVGCSAASSGELAGDDLTGSGDRDAMAARYAAYEAEFDACVRDPHQSEPGEPEREIKRAECVRDATSKLAGRALPATPDWDVGGREYPFVGAWKAVCAPRSWLELAVADSASATQAYDAVLAARVRCTIEGWRNVGRLVLRHQGFPELDRQPVPAAGVSSTRCRDAEEVGPTMTYQDVHRHECISRGVKELYLEPLTTKIEKNGAFQALLAAGTLNRAYLRTDLAEGLNYAGAGGTFEICAAIVGEGKPLKPCLSDVRAITEDALATLAR